MAYAKTALRAGILCARDALLVLEHAFIPTRRLKRGTDHERFGTTVVHGRAS